MLRRMLFLVVATFGVTGVALADDSGVHLFDDQNADGVSDQQELGSQSTDDNGVPSQFVPTGETEPDPTDSDGSNTGSE